MYFKFIILIIPFIIAASSVMGNLEEEYLQRSYDYAREIYHAPSGRGLKACDISNFVEHVNYVHVENYFRTNGTTTTDEENINCELFTKIVRALCEVHGFDVLQFLTERIRVIDLETKECEQAYNFAKMYYNVPPTQGLTDSNLRDFLGKNNEMSIEEYWEKNNVPFENRENIDLMLFQNVVRSVCKSYKFIEREFTCNRMKAIGKALSRRKKRRIAA